MATEKGWREAAVPVCIYAWALAWIFSRHFPYLPASYDSAYYLVSAKGFATGHYYKDFSSPDPNAGALLGPSFYPLILSLYWRFLQPNLLALQIATAMIMAVAPVAAYFWLGLWLAAPLALLLSLAFGSSYMFIVLGNSFMTEVVFTPILYSGMWLTYSSLQRREAFSNLGKMVSLADGRQNGKGKWLVWVAMLLWVVAARTRVVGWLFFAAFSFFAAKARRWKVLLTGIGLAAVWVAVERALAIGAQVTKYTDGMFTKTYPIQVDFWKGISIWWENVWHNVHGFTTSIDAHILFPYLYDLIDMNWAKRGACLGVFLWTAWGAWISWRRWEGLRPWLAAAFAASLPTFLIFQTNDSFRYHMPYFPFLALFFVAPFVWLAEGTSSPLRKRLPLLACLLIAGSQSLHAARHDFETEFMTSPREFNAVHDSLLAMPNRPEICLSPITYYTYLRTGVFSLHLQGRHELDYVREISRGKEVWAICGPTNDFLCEDWERKGVTFGNPPLKRAGEWRLHRVVGWPGDPPEN